MSVLQNLKTREQSCARISYTNARWWRESVHPTQTQSLNPDMLK